MVTVLDVAVWNLLGVSNLPTEWGGCRFADNALIGRGRTEGTAAVPQREKTLCTREWALLSGMTNYKFSGSVEGVACKRLRNK